MKQWVLRVKGFLLPLLAFLLLFVHGLHTADSSLLNRQILNEVILAERYEHPEEAARNHCRFSRSGCKDVCVNLI